MLMLACQPADYLLILKQRNGQIFGMASATHAIATERTGTYAAYRYRLLSPRRIRELSALDPGHALRDIAVCWAFILGAITLVAIHPAWWTVLLAIPVIGNRYYGLFIIGHDGMHRRLFPKIKQNDFWNDLLILAPIGTITRINNRNHMMHHRSLATSIDPDRHKHGCFNKAEHAEFLGYLSGLLSVWATAKSVFVTRGETSQRNTRANPASEGYT